MKLVESFFHQFDQSIDTSTGFSPRGSLGLGHFALFSNSLPRSQRKNKEGSSPQTRITDVSHLCMDFKWGIWSTSRVLRLTVVHVA